MPLTLSHAAVAWPVSRVLPFLPRAPLVIGTLVPDVTYFIRLVPGDAYSHSALGVLTEGLPISLAAWWGFERWVRPACLIRLPVRMRVAAEARSKQVFSVQGFALGALAVLLGAFSHVLWDSLTHPGLWSPGEVAIPGLPWSRTLQDASSAVGIAVLLLWAIRGAQQYPASDRVLDRFQRARLRTDGLVAVSAAIIGGLANGLRLGGEIRPMLARGALGAMAGLAVSLMALVAIDRFRTRGSKALGSADHG